MRPTQRKRVRLRLLETFARELKGTVEIAFAREGARCSLNLRVAAIGARGERCLWLNSRLVYRPLVITQRSLAGASTVAYGEAAADGMQSNDEQIAPSGMQFVQGVLLS